MVKKGSFQFIVFLVALFIGLILVWSLVVPRLGALGAVPNPTDLVIEEDSIFCTRSDTGFYCEMSVLNDGWQDTKESDGVNVNCSILSGDIYWNGAVYSHDHRGKDLAIKSRDSQEILLRVITTQSASDIAQATCCIDYKYDIAKDNDCQTWELIPNDDELLPEDRVLANEQVGKPCRSTTACISNTENAKLAYCKCNDIDEIPGVGVFQCLSNRPGICKYRYSAGSECVTSYNDVLSDSCMSSKCINKACV